MYLANDKEEYRKLAAFFRNWRGTWRREEKKHYLAEKYFNYVILIHLNVLIDTIHK